MTKNKHPLNKYQRKLIEEKRHKFVQEKKGTIRAERPAKIWHKLTIEQLKEQEAEEELRNASIRDRVSS
jgi:hypothetical protein